MVLRLTGIAVLLVVCVCAGCRKAANEMMEGAIESQITRDGGKADVQIGDEAVSFKIQDEKGESKFAYGENTCAPGGFSERCAAVRENDCGFVHSQQQNEMFVIQAKSADSLDQIAAFYKQEAAKQGWEEQSSTEQGSNMKALSYKKEGRMLQVIVAVTDDGTTLNINTGKNE